MFSLGIYLMLVAVYLRLWDWIPEKDFNDTIRYCFSLALN